MSKRTYKSKFISNIKFPYYNSWDKRYDYMTMDIKDIRLSLVNGVRRCIINSVKTIAFEDINIIIGGNKTKLNFFNMILCHTNKLYLNHLELFLTTLLQLLQIVI